MIKKFSLDVGKYEEETEENRRLMTVPAPVVQITPGKYKKKYERSNSNDRQQQEEQVRFGRVYDDEDDLEEGSQSSAEVKLLALRSNHGILQINLTYLELTDDGYKQLVGGDGGVSNGKMKLVLSFLDFKQASLIRTLSKEKRYDLDYAIVYRVEVDDETLRTMRTAPVSFALYSLNDDQENEAGRADLIVRDAVADPRCKVQTMITILNMDKGMLLSNTSVIKKVANLYLWYKLDYDPAVLQAALKRKQSQTIHYDDDDEYEEDSVVRGDGATVEKETVDLEVLRRKGTSMMSMSLNRPTASEITAFRDALTLVLSRNKSLRTTQSEISRELQDRTKWLHDESNWKRSLQEHAILCGEDPNAVEWRQWRDENTSNVRLRVYTSQPRLYEEKLTIEIVGLRVFSSASWVHDQTIKQLYVEYEFLGREGEDMETESLPKSKDEEMLMYRFLRTFPINLDSHRHNCDLIAAMIRNKKDLRFGVVSEPVFDPENYHQICEEVGYATVSLFYLVELEENEETENYPVYSVKNPTEVVGYLKLRFSGIQAMRRNALLVSAPSDYKIIL